MAFSGDFQPVLAKHSKHFSLQNALSIGVDQMQRNFDGMRMQVEAWRQSQLTEVAARLIIYRAFIEGAWRCPSIWPGPSTICISTRSTKNSSRERCGVCPMLS